MNGNKLSTHLCDTMKSIYKVAMNILNKNANSRCALQSTIETKTIRNFNREATSHAEFIYRSNGASSIAYCTLDISLKSSALKCDYFKSIFESLKEVKLLKHFYETINPNNPLSIVNWGVFSSPFGNNGQELHVDDEYLSITQTETKLPGMITVLISATKQAATSDDNGSIITTGSTRFALKSMHPLQKMVMLKDPIKLVQIVLDKGDVIAFGGNLLHAGGKFDFPSKKERILAYAVYVTEEHKKNSKGHTLQCTCWKCREDYQPFLGKSHNIVFNNGKWICVRKNGRRTAH